jgi:hypothetical protein
MTIAAKPGSVFDASLPTVAYHGVRQPDEAHAIIARAREQAPIALGPYGPELLTYDLVRLALRDPRFAMPQANGLAMRGVTSGPLWDKVSNLIVGIDGAAQTATPTRRQGIHPARCRTHAHGVRRRHQRTHRPPRSHRPL